MNPFESVDPVADEPSPAQHLLTPPPAAHPPPISANPFSDSFAHDGDDLDEQAVAAAAACIFNPFDEPSGAAPPETGGSVSPPASVPHPASIPMPTSAPILPPAPAPAVAAVKSAVVEEPLAQSLAALEMALEEPPVPVEVAVSPPTAVVAPIEVITSTFMADMLDGCAQLLTSGRHADLAFQLADGSLAAHRMIFEARCGRPFVQALEAGALGPVSMDQGWCLAVKVQGASAATVGCLLRFLYTEQFAPTGRAAAVALLQLIARLEEATRGAEADAAPSHAPAALWRLRQLCEQELSQLVDTSSVVESAHEAARIGASQLLAFCLQYMRSHFEELVARGGLHELHTPLCADLFRLRSDAPLQDAFAHRRAAAPRVMAPCRHASPPRLTVPPHRPDPHATAVPTLPSTSSCSPTPRLRRWPR